MFEAAGSRFRHDARHFRRVAVRHDHRIDAESRRRAQDRAGIVRIGDLIEHEHDAASRYDVREIEGLERQGFEHDALMHGARAKTTGEVLGRDDMGAKAGPRDFAFEPLERRLPWHKYRGFFAACRARPRAPRESHKEQQRRWPRAGTSVPWPRRFVRLCPARPDDAPCARFCGGGLAGRRIRPLRCLPMRRSSPLKTSICRASNRGSGTLEDELSSCHGKSRRATQSSDGRGFQRVF